MRLWTSGARVVGCTRLVIGALLLAGAVAGCAPGAATLAPPTARELGPAGEEWVVFLVRHAEAFREPGGDPVLTDEGIVRAGRLASVLRDAGIDVIHSSGLQRTDQTAAPLAALLVVEPITYDARDLPALADRLRDSTGRHLVVGHSNTTPEVVRLLGGEPGSEIDATEHDRLYVISRGPAGILTLLIRY